MYFGIKTQRGDRQLKKNEAMLLLDRFSIGNSKYYFPYDGHVLKFYYLLKAMKFQKTLFVFSMCISLLSHNWCLLRSHSLVEMGFQRVCSYKAWKAHQGSSQVGKFLGQSISVKTKPNELLS